MSLCLFIVASAPGYSRGADILSEVSQQFVVESVGITSCEKMYSIAGIQTEPDVFLITISLSLPPYLSHSSPSLFCLISKNSRPGLLKAGDPGFPWLADSWPSTSLPANGGLGGPKDRGNFGRGGKKT